MALDVDLEQLVSTLSTDYLLQESREEECALSAMLRDARGGKIEAFRRFVEATKHPLATYLRRRGVPFEDRDDVIQEVYIAAFRHLKSFDSNRAAKPWFFTIARHLVHRRLLWAGRKASLHPSLENQEIVPSSSEGPENSPERVLAARRTCKRNGKVAGTT